MQLIVSPWSDPHRNRALEEQLLTERPGDVLLLYINSPSVIVGKHQCIEAEVDVDYCIKHGIEIVKRISGGGTVYHDEGNINYALMGDKESGLVLDRDFTTPIVASLATLGIEARVGGRNELLCEGLKISGTASHITRNRQLFHGTLLHRTDLNRLRCALRGDLSKRGKSVASVPGEVMNISEITGADESTKVFLDRLIAALLQFYQQPASSLLWADRLEEQKENA